VTIGTGKTISAAVIQEDARHIYYTISPAVAYGDTVTWAYNSAVGNIIDRINAEPLPTVTAQTITNNVVGYTLPITANLKVNIDSRYGLYQDSAKTTAATADGHRLGALADQSGNGNDFLQATAGLRFTLKTNIQNALPAIMVDYTVDSVPKYMDCAAFVAELSQPCTMYIVGLLDDGTPGGWFCDGITGSKRWVVSRQAASQTSYRMYAGSDYISSTCDAGTMDFLTCVINGSSSKLRANGTEIASGNPGTNALDGMRLGANFLGSNPMQGYFMRLLIYTGAHTAAQIADVEGYLATLYDIDFTTNTPEDFYAAPPA
jgi:hypothetical protein